MNIKDVTPKALLEEVKRLQENYPNVVYEGDPQHVYGYAVGDTPCGTGCIVGQAYQNLGVSIDELKETERIVRRRGDMNTSITYMLEYLGYEGGTDIQELRNIQRCQDTGRPWGAC